MGAAGQGADSDSGRWMAIPRTLCFVTNGGAVLLMKRGEHRRVFPGLYNGIGGHIERDEDPFSGALREVREESGLTVSDLRLRGIVHIDAGSAVGIMLFVFTGTSPERAVTDCAEGTLHWIPLNEVARLPLVEDLPILLPRLFADGITQSASDAVFFAHVTYDAHDKLIMTFAGD